MLNVDYRDGLVDAVRVCTWPRAGGLAAWRVDLAGTVGEGMAFSIWFEDRPVALSTVILRSERSPVTMKPTGGVKMQILDAHGFERFVPQWRWLFTRLGIVPFGTSPLRGFGSGIAEDFDPWIGRFSVPLPELLGRASSLDRRIKIVTEEEVKNIPHPKAFLMAMVKMGPSLRDDIHRFLFGGPPDLKRTSPSRRTVSLKPPRPDQSVPGLLDLGAYLHPRAGSDDLFEEGGTIRLELMRLFPTSTGSAVTHVADWEGQSLVELVRWLGICADHLQWMVLDPDEWEGWFRQDSPPGELAIPEEEIEVLELLGEPLPFTWKNERLVAWAEQRER